ncbi:MAG: 3-hydroxyacyl-CoA dehydrogenase family protein, partial [Ghiorsea sp.]|nr:3-hydroxyacyl-CoA dehydrogenase family protein [Ghiorsea sp.]
LPQTQNLVRLFFLQDRLKAFGKGANSKVQRLHVIGAGVMGGDIAAWCAMQGIKVTLQDQDMQVIARATKRAAGLFQKKLREPRLVQAALDRLIPDLEGLGIAEADMVLEAIVENLEIKQSLYQSLEPNMKQGAVLATNTSGIPIDELASVLKQPERLIGIHFFNPVAKMKLVEVIAGQQTSDATQNTAYGFVTQIRKLPLPVKSSPGFLVNRILMPYLMEAVNMVDEGKQAEAIDKAATDFGMPMGPIALADTVGLDICLAVAQDLADVTGDQVPEFLQTWVKEGRLGKKSGQGFYRYNQGKAVTAQVNISAQAQQGITDRLISRIVNEAQKCLKEAVVEDADLLDAGMVFGTGLAPFRGGVMKYIQDKEEGNKMI